MIVNHITDLIGDTPMLKIPAEVHGLCNVNLYAKMEMLNPWGSVKDRIAWAMIKDDLDDLVSNHKMIVENSSGNTAKALQAIAGSFDVPFKLMTTMAKVKEPKDILRVMGAQIEELTQASTDCFDPNDPNDPQYVIERFVQESNGKAFFPSQFTNEKNLAVHRQTTGQEIKKDLDRVDWLIGGLGTTGSTRGILEVLSERDKDIKAIGVCSKGYDTIPGIRNTENMMEAGLFDKSFYDIITPVYAKDAVDAMIELNRRCALLCGPSAGAQYAVIKDYFSKNAPDQPVNVVFLACDRMEWYLSYIEKYRPDLFGKTKDGKQSYTAFYPDEKLTEQYQIVPSQMDQWVEDEQAIIVDMRGPMSLKVFSIEGAINIPEMILEEMLEKTQPFPKGKKLLVLCAVGFKSLKVAAYLREQNIEAYSLVGGINAYQSQKKKIA